MASRSSFRDSRGFTFVELLVTAAVTVLVFGGLMAAVQFAVQLTGNAKAKTGAVSLANERLEYIRSLAYADIGTIAGIPSGPLPQNATTTLNGILYHERILIQYIDGEEDGVGGADVNGILADYKRVKVEYSWLTQNGTSSIYLISDIAPAGIESTDGGGTLRVNVFDADILPVQSAAVRVVNHTTTSTIDTTRYTNAEGVAFFAGAPAAAQYEISVTRAGYSTDGTYTASTSNPDPITPPAAVIEGAVSTMNFQIDRLSQLTVRTVEPATTGTMNDVFDDGSQVFAMSDVTVSGGDVALSGAPGSYAALGTIQAASTTPSSIDRWGVATWNASTSAATEIRVRVYEVSGDTYTLVPDTDLPGNSAGFTSGPISLSGLSGSAYPTLALGATLESADVNETPLLHAWSLSYIVDEPPIGGVDFTLESTKVIGTTPVYKYQEAHTTDGNGEVVIEDLEWGLYKVLGIGGGFDVKEACAALPFPLTPGIEDTLTLTLVPGATRSLRVSVLNADGDPITGAEVDVTRSGFSATEESSVCGQVFFNSGLVEASDYEIAVDAPGYVTQTLENISIIGDEAIVVTLVAS